MSIFSYTPLCGGGLGGKTHCQQQGAARDYIGNSPCVRSFADICIIVDAGVQCRLRLLRSCLQFANSSTTHSSCELHVWPRCLAQRLGKRDACNEERLKVTPPTAVATLRGWELAELFLPRHLTQAVLSSPSDKYER